MEGKKTRIILLSQQTDTLRQNIHHLSGVVLKVNRGKHRLDQGYAHLSLQPAFHCNARRTGPTHEHVYKKTVKITFPELRPSFEEGDCVRRMLKKASTFTSLFRTFIVYALFVGLICLCYRAVCTVCQRFTIPCILFIADIAFSAVCFIVCFCYKVIIGYLTNTWHPSILASLSAIH